MNKESMKHKKPKLYQQLHGSRQYEDVEYTKGQIYQEAIKVRGGLVKFGEIIDGVVIDKESSDIVEQSVEHIEKKPKRAKKEVK